MFDKFGEFDSAEELNRAAAAQKEEGDHDALVELALENGLEKEDAEDYWDGIVPDLTSVTMAAQGKLDAEMKELNMQGVLADMGNELKFWCTQDKNMAVGIRRKGKDLAGYMALVIDAGYRNRVTVDRRITNQTKDARRIMGEHDMQIGVPTAKERKDIAEEYYKGGAK